MLQNILRGHRHMCVKQRQGPLPVARTVQEGEQRPRGLLSSVPNFYMEHVF